MAQRWRAVDVRWRGYVIAYVRNNESGEVHGVYKRFGRWRLYGGTDAVVTDAALAACARRAIANADPAVLRREFTARVHDIVCRIAEAEVRRP